MWLCVCVSVCTVPETDSVVQCHHAQEDTDVCKECSCQARYVCGCLCFHAGGMCVVCVACIWREYQSLW